jgi:hypothetical protein
MLRGVSLTSADLDAVVDAVAEEKLMSLERSLDESFASVDDHMGSGLLSPIPKSASPHSDSARGWSGSDGGSDGGSNALHEAVANSGVTTPAASGLASPPSLSPLAAWPKYCSRSSEKPRPAIMVRMACSTGGLSLTWWTLDGVTWIAFL